MDDQIKNHLMLQSLSEGLSNIYGKRKVIKSLNREPMKSSSFAAERIRILLEDGEWLNIFFKDLNPKNLRKEAKKIRKIGLERSHRELLMYRKVLKPLALGTPILYGYRWNQDKDIYWIFIEDAGPDRLNRLGDFNLWIEAARWIARLHAIDHRELSEVKNILPNYNQDHYIYCARRIEENLLKFDQQQQKLISQALDHYYRIMQHLNSLPSYLIHGEYFGKNVVIRPGKRKDSIAAIDWETAAFGPRSVDLVSISAGRWTPEQRKVMFKAYAEQFEIESGEKVEIKELEQEIKNVAVYRALWWLGYWANGDDVHITRWMKELVAVL